MRRKAFGAEWFRFRLLVSNAQIGRVTIQRPIGVLIGHRMARGKSGHAEQATDKALRRLFAIV